MLLRNVMSDTELINDDTDVTICGTGWKRRGNWYEDHMLQIVSEYEDAIVRVIHLHDYLDIGRTVEIIIRDI